MNDTCMEQTRLQTNFKRCFIQPLFKHNQSRLIWLSSSVCTIELIECPKIY